MADVFRRQGASGVGVRQFCVQEGLPEHRFHWWRGPCVSVPGLAAIVAQEIREAEVPKRPGSLARLVGVAFGQSVPSRKRRSATWLPRATPRRIDLHSCR